MQDWHLYLIRTRNRALYAGITTDVRRRFEEHCGSDGKGAKYLRASRPLELVYQAKIGDRVLALKAEHSLKRLSKVKKERIVSEKPEREALLDLLGLQYEGHSQP